MPKKTPKDRAESWLQWLRSGKSHARSSDFDDSLRKLRKCLKKDNLSLKDLGTTEEELEELAVKHHKTQIADAVDKLRRTAEGYKILVIEVVHETRMFGQVMTNFNDARKPANPAWVDGQQKKIKELLENMARKKEIYYDCLAELREKIRLVGNCSISDVGITEEEIASFSKLLTEGHLARI